MGNLINLKVMDLHRRIMEAVHEVLREYYGDWPTFRPDHPTNAKYEANLFVRLMTEALKRAGVAPQQGENAPQDIQSI